MRPQQSVQEFTKFAAQRGVSIYESTPRTGIETMFSFYKSVLPAGCEPDDGDMLLFQWGTYDWGQGESFEINITRQFMECAHEDDEALSQLSLTYRFEPTEDLRLLGEGNRWCDGPTEFDLAREFALAGRPLASVEALAAKEVSLEHSYV